MADIKFNSEDLIVNLWVFTRFRLILNIFVKRLNKTLIITVLILSGNAKAYGFKY